MSAFGGKADMPFALHMSAFDPKRTLPISCPHPFQSTTAGCYGAVLNLGEAMSQRDKAGGKVVKTQRRTALKRRIRRRSVARFPLPMLTGRLNYSSAG